MRKNDRFGLLEKALSLCKADEAEILLVHKKSGLTRFTQNTIHQNLSSENTELKIRIIKGDREGAATTNRLDEEGLKRAASQALESVLAQKKGRQFPGLPRASKTLVSDDADPATERCSPARRAGMVKKIISLSKKHKADAAGALSTTAIILAVANSSGIRSLHNTTRASLNFVPSRARHSGYTFWTGRTLDDLPLEELTEEALLKIRFSSDPVALEPGVYPVVLSPYAVGRMIEVLSYAGFGAKAYLEKRSFMTNLMGKKVASEKITIYDDGHDLSGLPLPFDYEGVLKRKVFLIKKGVAAGVVYDSRTAAKAGVKNTGHALPAPNIFGPYALNLFLSPGKHTEEDLLKSLDKGLYITKFHYTNIVEPVSTVITGMTKDGTFWIEKGKIAAPVRNLRFTQNVLEALKNVEAIGKEQRSLSNDLGAITAPALLIRAFTFTGVSEL